MSFRKYIKKWLYSKCHRFYGAFPYFKTKVYFPANSLLFYTACDQGVYEADILKIIQSLIKSDSTFIDVGANIGLMSVPVLYSNNSVKVISFEPSPNSLPYLLKTRNQSGFKDRWQVIGKAAGIIIGEVDFFIAKAELGAFDGINKTQRAAVLKTVKVPITTIDFEWENVGRPNVSVIKIDVEGAEKNTILGAIACINSNQPYILIEWNRVNLRAYNCNPNELFKLAIDFKYEIYSMPNLINILDENNLFLQMMLTENFLLVPKHDTPAIGHLDPAVVKGQLHLLGED